MVLTAIYSIEENGNNNYVCPECYNKQIKSVRCPVPKQGTWFCNWCGQQLKYPKIRKTKAEGNKKK